MKSIDRALRSGALNCFDPRVAVPGQLVHDELARTDQLFVSISLPQKPQVSGSLFKPG
jgi:hypothetical protein